MNDTTAKKTLVEEGTELTGTLKSTCPVVVNGTIDGEFAAPELTVTSSGAVLGTIKVDKLKSEGTLSGDIEAGDVYLAGAVKSNTIIKASSLEVKLSAERGKLEVTFGECMLDVGDEPSASSGEGSERPNSGGGFGFPRPEGNGGLWNKPAEDAPPTSSPPNGVRDSVAPPG